MQLNPTMQAEYDAYKAMNIDPYGNGVIRFSEAWADLMEQQIAVGATISDIAESTSRDADTVGITGFMYGCAVSSLAHFWVHGESLRRWHNKDVQIGDEGDRANKSGGVLNPALLNIKVR